MGPSTSSTLPMAILFSRKICALNWGTTVGFVDCTSISPSTACTNVPISVVMSVSWASIYRRWQRIDTEQ